MDNEQAETRTGVVLILTADESEELARILRRRGSFATVGTARLEDGSSGLREALADVLAAGVARVLIAATAKAADFDELPATVEQEIARQQVYHPDLGFVYVPPDDVKRPIDELMENLESTMRETDGPEGMPLSALPPHRPGTVCRLTGGREFVSRLAALGFIPGCPIEVIQNFGVGPLIVAIRDTRIALGRQEAEKVEVRPSNGGGRPHRRRHGPHGRRSWHRG